MIKRILVALDPDIDTQVATKYAIRLADKFDAALTGLALVNEEHINASVGTGGVGTIYYAEQLREHMTEQAREEAGKLLETFENTVGSSGVKHSEIMEEGVPYERIIEDMKYHDLLILGRDSHFFYNKPKKKTDTLAKVIKNGPAPALVVTEAYRDVNRVLVAVDGSTASARTMQWFVHLMPYGKDLAVHLAHVSGNHNNSGEDSKLLLRLAREYLKAHEIADIHTEILETGNPGERLLEFQQQVSADLFVMGAHSMSAIRRLTFGSTTHKLVTESKIPLFLSH